jgi:trypsin
MTTDNTTENRFKPAEIVGGQIAPSPIPWQVSVQSGGSHFCGGTILDTYTILSAAHCFGDHGGALNGLSIRAGSKKWSSGGQVC